MSKVLEINVGKSIDPNTGSEWWRADIKVSVGEGEVPKEVFEKYRNEIQSWLPNPFNTVSVVKSTPVFEQPVPANEQIQVYYEIINQCDTKKKLEMYRGVIWKTDDKDLINSFCEKLNQLP